MVDTIKSGLELILALLYVKGSTGKGTYVFRITVSDAQNQEHEPYAVIIP